jgi:hypothetical protein
MRRLAARVPDWFAAWYPAGALAMIAITLGSAWTGGRVYLWELTAWGLIAGCFAGGVLLHGRTIRAQRAEIDACLKTIGWYAANTGTIWPADSRQLDS